MSRKQRIKSKTGYYHIMLRGNEKRNIFFDDEDRIRFLETIQTKKQGQRFYLHGFCLMNNHVHLIISEGNEDISAAIKRIAVSYVFYFNKKYKRVGHLFQDRFKSEAVENEAYILSLAKYIHFNPVKANMVDAPGEYKWSSYNPYIDEQNYLAPFLDKEILLSQFSNDRNKAKSFFVEYMNQRSDESYLDIPETDETIDEGKVLSIYQKLLQQKEIKQENSIKKHIPEEVISELKKLTGLSIRRIAVITGLSKEKVHQMLRNSMQ